MNLLIKIFVNLRTNAIKYLFSYGIVCISAENEYFWQLNSPNGISPHYAYSQPENLGLNSLNPAIIL